jgi:hypothetical protein
MILRDCDDQISFIHSTIEGSGSMSKETFSGIEITLSTTGFRNLPRNVYENDFAFIVGESRYYCPSFIASFLSPRICCLQMKDSTIREFCIETEDPTHSFEKLLEVCYGSSFRVCENVSFFKSIFCELHNRELYEQMNELNFLMLSIDLNFLISRIECCEREIDFCSSHFYEIELKTLGSHSLDIFSSIISNSSIRLNDEDSLYKMISFRQNEDSQFFSLFASVRFEYLSKISMSSFIQLMTESFDHFAFPIWCSLCSRLSLSNSIDCSSDRNIYKRYLCLSISPAFKC